MKFKIGDNVFAIDVGTNKDGKYSLSIICGAIEHINTNNNTIKIQVAHTEPSSGKGYTRWTTGDAVFKTTSAMSVALVNMLKTAVRLETIHNRRRKKR
jgi:hypothetical protein